MTEVLRVAEWARVDLPAHLDTPSARRRIVAGSMTSLGPALVARGRGVYAQGLVGIVAVGAVQIEVVPKIYDDSTVTEDSHLLLELFATVVPGLRGAVSSASTATGRESMIEPIIRHLAAELERGLRVTGVPRRYERVSEVGPTLRGKVEVAQLARRPPVYCHRLPIQHFPLQTDNALTRVLRALALELSRMTRSARTHASLERSGALLEEAKPIELTPAAVGRVVLSRLDDRWATFVQVAELLTAGRTPAPFRRGRVRGLGLVMPLEGLFEGALLASFARSTPAGTAATRSTAGTRLLRELDDGRELLSIRPDIVLKRDDGAPLVVIDAKWKRLRVDRRTAASRPADLYQIHTYIHRYDTRVGALVFPSTERLSAGFRVRSLGVLPAEDRVVHLVEIDVGTLLGSLRRSGGGPERAQIAQLVGHLLDGAASGAP